MPNPKELAVFFHYKGLQFEAKPDRPDPVLAKHLQELLGGAVGEMTVAMQYLFQGWNCRVPGKYKDLILDTATEELAHVEMIATMIARLLEGAPEDAYVEAAKDPMTAAIISGTNPQHKIVNGLGPALADSAGEAWSGKYILASGNLFADFSLNAAVEMQGRLQATRVFNMTDDSGVREMLKFNIARDTMHQNQWLAACEELKADGLEGLPSPSNFPESDQNNEFAYTLFNFSEGSQSSEGRWASGPTPDGKGTFTYVDNPQPMAPEPVLPPTPPQYYGTPSTGGGIVQKVKDILT
nr:manganese catalase family protein [Motilibacter aurantiacus]